jgi:general secretion pathway protein G
VKTRVCFAALGFTLIEVLVVMAIMGTLTMLAMPLSEALVKSQKERMLKNALWEIRDAIDRYKRMHDQGLISTQNSSKNGYPVSLSVLVLGSPQGEDHQAAVSVSQHFFLRRMPRDPFADSLLPAEKTWGLRSYASPPDRPQAGEDVYDVHSTSDAKALDGTAYKDW